MVISMKWSKIKNLMSTLNVIRKYREYKYQLNELASHNTMEVSKFMTLDNEQRDITLFCLTAALKLKQESMSKILYTILTVSLGGTALTTYLGVI